MLPPAARPPHTVPTRTVPTQSLFGYIANGRPPPIPVTTRVTTPTVAASHAATSRSLSLTGVPSPALAHHRLPLLAHCIARATPPLRPLP